MKIKTTLTVIFLFLLFINLCKPVCYAEFDTDLSLETDKNEITENEELGLSIKFKNKGHNNINLDNINIPGLENFQTVSNYSSNKVQIINGNILTITSQEKTLNPKKIGKFTLGPVKIKYKDSNNKINLIESNSVQIKVNEKVITKNKESKINEKSTASNEENIKIDYISILVVIFIFSLIYLYLYFKKKEKEEIMNNKNESKELVLPKTEDENFYEKISYILKDSLRKKYKSIKQTSTTQEITEILSKNKYYKKNEIAKIFEEIDKNKFAKSNLNKNNILEQLKNII